MSALTAAAKSRSVQILLALVVLVGAGLVIRSAVLPSQSAALFVKYRGDNWVPATENPLFAASQIVFAGYEPVQLAGDDLGQWDEVVVASFSSRDGYDAFAGALEGAEQIADYHLMQLAPQAPELLTFLNWRLRGYRNDESIDPGERVPIAEVVPDPSYLPRWQQLFGGAYRDGIVMLNLMFDAEDPQDPADPDTDASAEELYQRYSDKATRVLGRLGGQISVLGTVDQVVVGPAVRKYDTYAFVYYPSVAVFETMFTARERVEAQVYQRAALGEDSSGYWVKPYPQFVPVP